MGKIERGWEWEDQKSLTQSSRMELVANVQLGAREFVCESLRKSMAQVDVVKPRLGEKIESVSLGMKERLSTCWKSGRSIVDLMI